jgi:hypothetical protein
MEDEPTCGKGLAAQAVLPASIGRLAAAMAAVLEHHLRALDEEDAASRAEHDAYTSLVAQLTEAAGRLDKIGQEMTGYHDLPMGRHDERALAGSEAISVFERFVEAERALRDLLAAAVHEHSAMLGQMR